MSDTLSNPPKSSLTSLELFGALSARLVHSLSNHLSIMTGNVCVATKLRDEPEKIAAALESALESGRQAGNLLGSFAEMRHAIKTDLDTCSMQYLARSLEQWGVRRTGWQIEIDPELRSRIGLAIPTSWTWLAFILDAIVDESQAESGVMRLVPVSDTRRIFGALAPNQAPSAGATRLSLIYNAKVVTDWNEVRVAFKKYHLIVSYELLQMIGGRLEAHAIESGAQETRLVLPLIQVDPGSKFIESVG